MAVDVERSPERRPGTVPGWVPVLVSIVALVYLVWVFHGRIWVTDHAHQSPAHHGHVRVTGTTIPTLKSPTVTPTTNSPTIVPLPPNNNCPTCIPQPSFAPAP